MEKEEVYIDEKIGDAETPQVNLEEDDDSPIEEVRVSVLSMCLVLLHPHLFTA